MIYNVLFIVTKRGLQICGPLFLSIKCYYLLCNHYKLPVREKKLLFEKKTCKIICQIKIKHYLCIVNKKQTDLTDFKKQ